MVRREGYDMESTRRSRHPPPWARLSGPESPCWFWARRNLVNGIAFAAGLIPAAVLAVCLLVVVYVRARVLARPTQRASLQEMRRAAFARHFRC